MIAKIIWLGFLAVSLGGLIPTWADDAKPIIQCEDVMGNINFVVFETSDSKFEGLLVNGSKRMKLECQTEAPTPFLCGVRESDGVVNDVIIRKNQNGRLYGEYNIRIPVNSGGWPASLQEFLLRFWAVERRDDKRS